MINIVDDEKTFRTVTPVAGRLPKYDLDKLSEIVELDGLSMSVVHHLYRVACMGVLLDEGGWTLIQDASVIHSQLIRTRGWITIDDYKYIYSYPIDELTLIKDDSTAVSILAEILTDIYNEISELLDTAEPENGEFTLFFSHVFNKVSVNRTIYQSRETGTYTFANYKDDDKLGGLVKLLEEAKLGY